MIVMMIMMGINLITSNDKYMKAIELTEEHESKLLEMIKILFPEYLVPTIQPNGYINIAETEYSSDYIDLIHWFEFCMTHLVDKIFESFEEDDEDFYDRYINNGASFYGVGVSEIIFVMLNSKKHPVDYLYEEFKKLK